MASAVATVPDVPPMDYKMVLCGPAGAGRTTFMKQLTTGRFDTISTPSAGVEVRPTHLGVRRGGTGPLEVATFSVWDVAGADKFAGLRPGYYIGADCAVIMVDASARASTLPRWRSGAASWRPRAGLTCRCACAGTSATWSPWARSTARRWASTSAGRRTTAPRAIL